MIPRYPLSRRSIRRPRVYLEQDRTKANKKLFLAVFSMTLGNVTKACQRAQIHRDTYYDWCKRDPEFIEAAKSAAYEGLEYFANRNNIPDYWIPPVRRK